jgi:catalase (peroxidase I)
MKKVKKDLENFMKKHPDGEYVRLALQCANTFRATDYMGGCNGARIRFPPGSNWSANDGLGETLALLKPVKKKYGDGLSWADLIVLAGNVAAERVGSPKLSFCPGRTDDSDGKAWKHLEYGNSELPATVDELIERFKRRGQTAQEFVALTFVDYGSTDTLRNMLNANNPGDLLAEALQFYPELKYWADYYVASGNKEYGADFAVAWTKLMNADRFDGPVRNACA